MKIAWSSLLVRQAYVYHVAEFSCCFFCAFIIFWNLLQDLDNEGVKILRQPSRYGCYGSGRFGLGVTHDETKTRRNKKWNTAQWFKKYVFCHWTGLFFFAGRWRVVFHSMSCRHRSHIITLIFLLINIAIITITKKNDL